jgi:predicted DNA-binding transcriptional regulator YafY
MPRKAGRIGEQLVRLNWFHDLVSKGEFPSASLLMEHFEVSSATAYKDIEALKTEYNAPLSYDGAHRGFTYKDPAYTPAFVSDPAAAAAKAAPAPAAKAVPAAEAPAPEKVKAQKPSEAPQPAAVTARRKRTAQLAQDELVTILVAEMLNRSYRTAPFADVIKSAFNKVADSMDGSVTYDRESLDRILEIELHAFPALDLTVFDALAKAIEDKETVVLKYFSGQKATVTSKVCDPLHLLNYRDNWYLVAYCHEKQDYRDFLMNRILSLEFTDRRFKPYHNFDIEEHKVDSTLLGGQELATHVLMEFDKYAAHWIRLRQVHPSQKIVERTDGSLELSFTVFSYENLLRWILSFGEHARVLRPFELQERVKRTIQRMNHLYGR